MVTLRFLGELGSIYYDIGMYTESVATFQSTLTTQLEEYCEHGKRSNTYVLEGIGKALRAQKQYEAAAVYYEKTLSSSLLIFGALSFDTEEIYWQLRECYDQLGRHGRVSELANRYIRDIRAAKYGDRSSAKDLETKIRTQSQPQPVCVSSSSCHVDIPCVLSSCNEKLGYLISSYPTLHL
jgi:tetratricopeptide (TPR) repeat protein